MKIRLGESIRKLQKEKGYTQEKLAEVLGVTPGSVYKWEADKAVPEIEMLVDIAEFFETSVDAMLNYECEKLSMGKASQKLHSFFLQKDLESGMRFAEQVLIKYPNSFDIVYHSAEIFFLTMKKENMQRAVDLYERAADLIDQNTRDDISTVSIQNRIAYCYWYMDRQDEAIAIFKKNNAEGANDFRMGLLLSQKPGRAEDALPYLSSAMIRCYSELYNTCIGYANAYEELEKWEQIIDLISWFYALGNGLRHPDVINWMDRGNVKLCLILAEVNRRQGHEEEAMHWLAKAKETALRFDSAPDFRTHHGLRYSHGEQAAMSYDDMGDTAMDVILNFLADETAGSGLRSLWKQMSDTHQRG